MIIRIGLILLVALIPVGLSMLFPAAVGAHQPYCEVDDLTAGEPMRIENPTVSKAIYSTLDSPEDVDYYTFSAEEGDAIFLGMTIPQIIGQEEFAPMFALIGEGLSDDVADLPGNVETWDFTTMFAPPAIAGPVDSFFEPFSFTHYWPRQEVTVTLPETGDYTIAVWHPGGETGRYVLVVGSLERLGGDYGCYNENNYWIPVGSSEQATAVSPGLWDTLAELFGGHDTQRDDINTHDDDHEGDHEH